jgi:hypothetical protein
MSKYISRGAIGPSKPPLDYKHFSKLDVLLKRPFAILAFKFRERTAWKTIVPRRWLSPGELLTRDLEEYEPQGDYALDLKFIDDFAKARDELFAKIKKQMIFSFIAFVFASAKYLGIKLNFNVGGFSLADTPGALEALLLISNLLACYTLMLQGNVFLIETAIKHAINRSVPDELKRVYLVRYFPHEHFGVYQPFNLPHLIPNASTRTISKYTALLFLVLLVGITGAYAVSNIALLFYYLWFHPQLGVLSYALLAFILACGVYAFSYVILTRVRLPYLDYTVNHELELLQQVDPERYKIRLQEIYGSINADRRRMEELGYLRRRERTK